MIVKTNVVIFVNYIDVRFSQTIRVLIYCFPQFSYTKKKLILLNFRLA